VGVRAAGGDAESGARIDETDRAIIGALTRDARLSARAVAREIDLAPTTVGDRMERMELAQVLRGYHADADPAAMGYPLQCLMALQTTQATPLEETIDQLMQLPAVAEVFVVTGQWDLLVRLQLADQPELESVLLDDVWSMPSFRHSETMMVLRERRRLPRWADA